MNVLLIRMGGTLEVSAFSVLMYCSDLVQPVLYGLCDSMQPAIGYNWGAASYKRVKTLAKCVFTSTAVVSAFAFALMFSIPRQQASIFVDSSEIALPDLSARALKLFSEEFFFWWFGFAAQSFFNAIQKPKKCRDPHGFHGNRFPASDGRTPLASRTGWPVAEPDSNLHPCGNYRIRYAPQNEKTLAPEMQ